MNRRDFLAVGAGGALGSAFNRPGGDAVEPEPSRVAGEAAGSRSTQPSEQIASSARRLFPRLENEIFLNAAGGTPLGAFAEAGLRGFEDFWRLGPDEGRGESFAAMLSETRAGIAEILGARSEEIAFVQCTKQGEQIVLDGLPALREGGNVVTNDLHFAGSLHNLIGLRRAGLDVRIVASRDWRTDVDAMRAAIDDETALVSVTLVSNVNGHVEPIRELADIAHAHGAHVYADVIQAAGIVPVDVREMGIDFAAGNGYKWLFGPHGTGYLYVREELQGEVLEDRLFPGHVGYNYEPWVEAPDPDESDFLFEVPTDAQRYQPGHLPYLCYAAVREGMGFIDDLGVENVRSHSVNLNSRLLDALDPDRYACISPHVDRSPIITFRFNDPGAVVDLADRLSAANLVVSLSGSGRIRVSPAIFNNEDDVDALIEVLGSS